MSKINAIRIVNLNYNNNTMKIDDEYFELNGENTLLSLMNGGGKTVLVQMVMAPFISRGKRNLGKRNFKDYFTTNKPTFILVEWQLDGKAGYVLTGMMVRKSIANDELGKEDELDIINFIYEYKSPNTYDIRNIPIIEINEDKKVLKGYQSCERLFEELKNKKGNAFSFYNGNNYAQQRNYFDKLEQYQIYRDEWETIVKSINEKESGLSELFNNAKDEIGLLEKWFLVAVKDKLNRNGDRIKNFEELMSKCIKQYKDNKHKILQKENMLKFKKETEGIYNRAKYYQNAIIDKQNVQMEIAILLLNLKELNKNYSVNISEHDSIKRSLEDEIRNIKYQSLCYDIILKQEELDTINEEINKLELAKDSHNMDLKDIELSKNLLLCAEKYEVLQAANARVREYETKLKIINEENTDIAPKINELGYTLKCYYDNEYQKVNNNIQVLEKLSKEISEEINQIDKEIAYLQEKATKFREDISRIKANIKSYDSFEEKLIKKYNLKIARNILGLYEENFLEGLKLNKQNLLDELNKSYKNNQKQKYELEKEKTEIEKYIPDIIEALTNLKSSHDIKLKQNEANEKIIELRREAIKYLNTPIDDVFDVDKIIEEFNKKIEEIEKLKRIKEKELDEEQALYKNLELGKVLDISSELRDALENEDIRYVYGMDWIKNNGYTAKKNEQLISNNPMIPYSIILSSKDLVRLKNSNISIFTSQPIPIILREYLDNDIVEDSNEGAVFNANKELSFYVLFNKDILYKDKLAKILEDKRQKIGQILENIEVRKNEIQKYTEKKHLLINSPLTRDEYNTCKEDIVKLEDEITKTDNKLVSMKKRQAELDEGIKSTEKIIKYQEKEIHSTENLLEDLLELIEAYQVYVSNLDEEKYLSREVDTLNENIYKCRDLILNNNKNLESNRLKITNLRINLSEIEKCVSKYSMYSSNANKEDEFKSKELDFNYTNIAALEAEFKAITEKFSSSQKEIIDNLDSAMETASKAEKALNNFIKQYNIATEDYKDIHYNYPYLAELENRKSQIEAQLKKLFAGEKPLVKKQGNIESDIEKLYNDLKSSFSITDILAKEEIKICDFRQEIFKLETSIKSEDKILHHLYDKNNIYQNSIYTLSEYEDYENMILNNSEALSQYDEIEAFDANKIKAKITHLKNDLKNKEDKVSDEHRRMTDEITRIKAIPEFSDDFYKNPLNNLFECRNIPSQVIEQLDTNWKAYSTLLEKLQIDIDIIESEKAEIVNLFTQYVQTVHNNLDSIDRNSSINIRGKSVKMLRIILPNWEDEESIYKARVNEFVDSLIDSGISLLENNQQIEEMLGKQITITNIYNRVVGCSKVSIKLYKIEANREVPITWAEAAKNSGGEGFLSAFVILSSLMMYLRRDETDIFLEKEEGKVLIMDNPFAQTSSDHLLRPLVEISKKSNTQLICLSALGGDSIYNRFDNIYVLTHTASKLQNGVSYLKSEHTKGVETTKNIISSRIIAEEVEQLSIF